MCHQAFRLHWELIDSFISFISGAIKIFKIAASGGASKCQSKYEYYIHAVYGNPPVYHLRRFEHASNYTMSDLELHVAA
jgi:hypothetical protein